MLNVVRSGTFTAKGAAFTRGTATIALLGAWLLGCDSHSNAIRQIDSDDLTVSMPLDASSGDVFLVAQPPRIPREIIPAPTGEKVVKKRPIKGEVVPAPPGEPETVSIMKVEKSPIGESAKIDSTPASVGGVGPDGAPAATGPELWQSWPTPQTVLFVTGNQHGYIEPCGCTGLENQKGGLARRFTLMKQLTEFGWPLVPMDAGNQVRRTGRQSEIKFQTAAAGLAEMKYEAIGFGPDDVRLGVGELIAVAAVDNPADGRFQSANVVLIDPSLMAQAKVVESGGRRIGITSALDPHALEDGQSDEIQVNDVQEKLASALDWMRQGNADFKVLMFYGEEEAAAKVIRQIPGFDLVVIAGGYGEPTYQAAKIEGTETRMIVTGNKGMYTGLVGLYADGPPRYARVALTHEFSDAPEMRRLMAAYQSQLESLGFDGLGLKPVAHPTGEKFVGTKVCGECHKTAFGIWENSAHALATQHLVRPGQRGDISRHFDPECVSCHVTGWNAQNFYPYETGYASLEASEHLLGNGCENCHGPGASHAAAERQDSGIAEAARDALRVSMRLPLENAKERCMECHDLDNSPDFHKEDAFDDFWAQVEHYGVD